MAFQETVHFDPFPWSNCSLVQMNSLPHCLIQSLRDFWQPCESWIMVPFTPHVLFRILCLSKIAHDVVVLLCNPCLYQCFQPPLLSALLLCLESRSPWTHVRLVTGTVPHHPVLKLCGARTCQKSHHLQHLHKDRQDAIVIQQVLPMA